MKISNLTLVIGYDWSAVYDQYGKLVYQGHSIDWEHVLTRNVCKLSSIVYCDNDWLKEYGSFPDRLSEVKLR